MARCKETEHRKTLAADWVRAPDAAFWYELFQAPPAPTEADRLRRQRIARYSLGAATVMSFLYTLSALLTEIHTFRYLVWLNGIATLSLAGGMWMASLGRHALAREMLMATATTQLCLLLWLTGNELMVSVFAPVLAVLGWVLYDHRARKRRGVYLLVTAGVFAGSVSMTLDAVVDISAVAPWLLVFTRAANALVALVALVLILATLEKEVLTSEQQLVNARQQSETLLHAVLPASIAARLREGEKPIADQHDSVTVLFADIVGFTPWAAGQPPAAVVSMLESVFSRFDDRLAETRAEKIKTIGDAYMAVCGAPAACHSHGLEMARLALVLLEEIHQLRQETGIDLQLRIGMHSGPVVAGVIGLTRFSFDVWGDTVNTASRMESHGEPGRIQISDDTRMLLGDRARCELRGDIEIKGRGTVRTWWLESVTDSEPG